ncbi:MAG TPA: adenylate/guanylate cyclase domain-containing protein [Burkholderiales bacterium]|nr:adenylate/guanylate cyclase domain-containing protein [Burkholderiales bacterium]
MTEHGSSPGHPGALPGSGEAQGEEGTLEGAVNGLARTLDARFREMGEQLKAARSVNPEQLLDEILDQLFESFREVIPYNRVGFALLEDGGRLLRARWARSDAGGMQLEPGYSAPMAGTTLQVLLEKESPRLLDDLEAYVAAHPGSDSTRRLVAEGMRSSLSCPLVATGRPVGFMFFSSVRPGAYLARHAELFQGVASELAALLEKGILYQQLLDAQERSERLLLNVMPASIAQRLKAGEKTIADIFPEATVLFADIAGFTQLSARMTPHALVTVLNRIFSAFDRLCQSYGVEKIKTIGDAIMVAAGLPSPRPDHVSITAAFALDLMAIAGTIATREERHIKLRIGVHAGPVIAGVIGTNRFSYDLWGDTVNIASRMESQGVPGRIQVSEVVYQRLKDEFVFEPRGTLQIRGIGELQTYFLVARKLADEL